MKRGFGSDNHSGVHPAIMQAILNANVGHEPSYGTDRFTNEAETVFKKHFGENTETHFVFNGTAANILALSRGVQSIHTVLTSGNSHLIHDECGAAEKTLGCRTVGVPTPDGKVRPQDLEPYLIRKGDQHFSQIKALSITQPTELGTLYSIDEILELNAFAKKHSLFFHIDGARLCVAAAALGCSFKEMTTDLGVDAVSFGGTKNGLMFGEAVLFLNPGHKTPQTAAAADSFKYVRKQLMQLPSKTRFIAAQFSELLGDGNLWRKNALHQIAMAKKLREGLDGLPQAMPTQKTEASAVFACFPKNLISRLKEVAFFYVWDEHSFECRLMMSWDTEISDIENFIKRFTEYSTLELAR